MPDRKHTAPTRTPNLTVALLHHRPEVIPFSVASMRRHRAIVLEEPPDESFAPMLAGALPIDDYLTGIDTEYPEFSRRMCRALRTLHQEGHTILQIEPFLERLLQIHDRFGEGGRPSDLQSTQTLWPVYRSERKATGALLSFYDCRRRLPLISRMPAGSACQAVADYIAVFTP